MLDGCTVFAERAGSSDVEDLARLPAIQLSVFQSVQAFLSDSRDWMPCQARSKSRNENLLGRHAVGSGFRSAGFGILGNRNPDSLTLPNVILNLNRAVGPIMTTEKAADRPTGQKQNAAPPSVLKKCAGPIPYCIGITEPNCR